MIIGINGFKGVGKDTVADYLVDKYDFTKLSFAGKLKEAVAALWGISVEEVERYKSEEELWGVEVCSIRIGEGKSFSWRGHLQRFGTEMGRNVFGEDFWVKQLLPSDFQHNGKKFVIADMRFENEMKRIKEFGGLTISITRPGIGPDGHASEAYPNPALIDEFVDNDGTIEELYVKIDYIMNKERVVVPT